MFLSNFKLRIYVDRPLSSGINKEEPAQLQYPLHVQLPAVEYVNIYIEDSSREDFFSTRQKQQTGDHAGTQWVLFTTCAKHFSRGIIVPNFVKQFEDGSRAKNVNSHKVAGASYLNDSLFLNWFFSY